MSLEPAGAVPASGLPGRAVRWHGIRLGSVVDVVLDRTLRRLLGIEVRNMDERHRFLPAPAFEHVGTAVVPASPLVLLGADALAFYRGEGIALSSLRGMPVRRNGDSVGAIDDVLLRRDGELASIVVSTPDGGRRALAPDALEVDDERRLAWIAAAAQLAV